MAGRGGRMSWGPDDGEDSSSCYSPAVGRRSQQSSPKGILRSPARTHGLHLPAYVRRKLNKGRHVGDRADSPGAYSDGSVENMHTFKYHQKRRYKDSYRDDGSSYKDEGSPYRGKGSPYRSDGSPYRGKGSPYRDDDPPYRDRSRHSSRLDPLVDPIRDPLRPIVRGSSRFEPQMAPREPRCYLDLFDPSVTVIRDPVLDEPPPPRSAIFSSLTRKLRPFCRQHKTLLICVLIMSLIGLLITLVAVLVTNGRSHADPRFDPPFVTTVTACGLVRGRIEGSHLKFLSIPYAVSPLSSPDSRLLSAKPVTRLEDCWQGTYSAVNARPSCWQYDLEGKTLEGEEDCLHLDIFTPQLGYDTPLPVVVYIGGSSMGGDLRWPQLRVKAGKMASQLKLVLVAPSIRRGPLGVMASPRLGESVYPPSAGGQSASDLTAALLWVSRNIEHFGGDPGSVTILGHQAGAAISYAVLSSSKVEGLIHRAWLTGAPPLHPHTTWRDAPLDLSEPFNCSTLSCLTDTPPEDLMNAMSLEYRRHHPSRPWLVADGVYITFEASPPRIPLMIGTTLHSEAEMLVQFKSRLLESLAPLDHHPLRAVEEVVTRVLSTVLIYNANSSYRDHTSYFSRYPKDSPWYRPPPPLPTFPAEESRAAVKLYSEDFSDPWTLLVTLISDAISTCPTLDIAAHLSRGSASTARQPSLPAHMDPQLHIIPSSSHPILFRPSDAPAVYSYVSIHNRSTSSLHSVKSVADANSDIDALFGILTDSIESDSDKNFHKSFQDKLQTMFSLFLELGRPERLQPVPAHLGAYLVTNEVTVERRRKLCSFWQRWRDLARRY